MFALSALLIPEWLKPQNLFRSLNTFSKIKVEEQKRVVLGISWRRILMILLGN